MTRELDEQEAFGLGQLIRRQAESLPVASTSSSHDASAGAQDWQKHGEDRLRALLRGQGLTTTSAERADSAYPTRVGAPPVQRAPAHSRPVSTTRPLSSRPPGSKQSLGDSLDASLWDGVWAGENVFGSRRKRQLRWAAAALAVAGLCGAVFFATLRSSLSNDLQFQVAEGPWRATGHVEAPEAPEVLEFTDGSRLTLAASSSLRVRATDADGAEVVIEHGALESEVIHAKKTQWSIFAGPYEVRVVGTRFSTEWDPATQKIAVILHEGTVQVLGAGIDGNVELRPGQRFDAGGASHWTVRPQASNTPAPEKTDGIELAHLETETPADAGDSEAQTPSPRDVAHPSATWGKLVAQGDFAGVLEAAKKRGIETCLQSCSSSDLRSLADAARYSGDVELARRALLRLRDVAPGERTRAGYLLGSLAEARGQAANALKWYGQYLTESPGGSLASEARAGRMRSLLALGQKNAAETAAREYLQLHPGGVGAKTAASILKK